MIVRFTCTIARVTCTFLRLLLPIVCLTCTIVRVKGKILLLLLPIVGFTRTIVRVTGTILRLLLPIVGFMYTIAHVTRTTLRLLLPIVSFTRTIFRLTRTIGSFTRTSVSLCNMSYSKKVMCKLTRHTKNKIARSVAPGYFISGRRRNTGCGNQTMIYFIRIEITTLQSLITPFLRIGRLSK